MNFVPPPRSNGTIQTQRLALDWPSDRPFRILSIDGGGIRGILPAAVLAEIERRFLGGQSIARHFDLIAGTSTGGIVALGLGLGKTAAEILGVYLERGSNIFPVPGKFTGWARSLRRVRRSKFDRADLESELLRIFGHAVLGESRSRLCIPTFEGIHGEPWIYKTPHHPDYKKDRHERMVRVACATTAAPTYFDAFRNDGYLMLDGGIWANNPIMNGLVDALACFDLGRRQVQILSVGCGEARYSISEAQASGGLVQWRGVFDAATRAQSRNALGQAYLLVGRDNVLRLDAPESPNAIQLDDFARAAEELPAVARALAEASGRAVVQMFLGTEADTYHPFPLDAR